MAGADIMAIMIRFLTLGTHLIIIVHGAMDGDHLIMDGGTVHGATGTVLTILTGLVITRVTIMDQAMLVTDEIVYTPGMYPHRQDPILIMPAEVLAEGENLQLSPTREVQLPDVFREAIVQLHELFRQQEIHALVVLQLLQKNLLLRDVLLKIQEITLPILTAR